MPRSRPLKQERLGIGKGNDLPPHLKHGTLLSRAVASTAVLLERTLRCPPNIQMTFGSAARSDESLLMQQIVPLHARQRPDLGIGIRLAVSNHYSTREFDVATRTR